MGAALSASSRGQHEDRGNRTVAVLRGKGVHGRDSMEAILGSVTLGECSLVGEINPEDSISLFQGRSPCLEENTEVPLSQAGSGVRFRAHSSSRPACPAPVRAQ